MSLPRAMRNRSAKLTIWLALGTLAFSARPANAQITKVTDDSGRRFFINANPPRPAKLTATKHTNIYLPAQVSFTGRGRPEMNIDRDGVEKIVREAADRHRMDPALVRAVIQTESNW